MRSQFHAATQNPAKEPTVIACSNRETADQKDDAHGHQRGHGNIDGRPDFAGINNVHNRRGLFHTNLT